MNKIKSWFTDFKKFISRGSVIDMAVGVIIGSAFSAIITAVVNNILMPIITAAIPGGFSGLVTVLNHSEAVVDPANVTAGITTVSYWGNTYNASIVNVINWGAFLNALVNFLIIALVLFIILKSAMAFSNMGKGEVAINKAFTRAEKKEMIKSGKSFAEIRELSIKKIADDKAKKAKADEEEKKNQVTELSLLKDIKDILCESKKD